jgi:hypothetical protein
MKYSGHSSLFCDGKEVGPVARLAICRGDDGEVCLFHCDRRWNVLGIAGRYPNKVEQMVSKRKIGLCGLCVRELNAMIDSSAIEPEA